MVSVLITLPLAFFFRFLPHLFSSGGLGVDHWYWKTYIETYRRERRFPPILPQYILEEYQWYPPLFPMTMAYFPEKIFDSYSHWVAIIIDLLRMMLLLGILIWWSKSSPWAIGIAGLVYATMPILVSYNIQLNPRGIGALFLDLLIVLLLWVFLFNGPLWIWGVILLLSGLIMLTHKMTTQLFWFLCIGAGILTRDWWFFGLIPASILVALIISKGFYLNVVRAHWDIVSFWHRNWRWLMAHPIRESTIYGEKSYETPNKVHRRGIKGFLRHSGDLIVHNIWVWVLIAVAVTGIFPATTLTIQYQWVFWWIVLIALFGVLTLFLPFLKSLGAGQLYFYNAAFPTALLWGMIFKNATKDNHVLIVFLIALLVNILVILRFYIGFKHAKTQKIDKNFEKVLEFLSKSPKGVVMCLPQKWYDVVAYKTGQPVLYGGHGYGFKLLEPVFPRLLIPVQEIIEKYKVRYLLTLDGYLNDEFQRDLKNFKSFEKFGQYTIFCM